jgi:hypothetical protein
MLSNKDMFCWDGRMWQLIGARFLPLEVVEVFLSYVSEGFPDADSVEWDLNFLLDTYEVLGKISEGYLPESSASLSEEEREELSKKAIRKFIDRVLEVCNLCKKNSMNSIETE